MLEQINSRALTIEDASAMMELRLLGLQTDAFAFGSSFEEESCQPLSFFENRCHLTDSKISFAAFSGEKLVALSALVRETAIKTNHHANIYSVYVHPEYRNQGIAALLIKNCIVQARRWTGVDWLQLGVASSNIAAIKVYKRLGFNIWGTQPDTLRIGDQSIDEHHMALNLRSN